MDEDDGKIVARDCKDCQRSVESYGARLCQRGVQAIPCVTARDYRGSCGLEAKHFIPIEAEK